MQRPRKPQALPVSDDQAGLAVIKDLPHSGPWLAGIEGYKYLSSFQDTEHGDDHGRAVPEEHCDGIGVLRLNQQASCHAIGVIVELPVGQVSVGCSDSQTLSTDGYLFLESVGD